MIWGDLTWFHLILFNTQTFYSVCGWVQQTRRWILFWTQKVCDLQSESNKCGNHFCDFCAGMNRLKALQVSQHTGTEFSIFFIWKPHANKVRSHVDPVCFDRFCLKWSVERNVWRRTVMDSGSTCCHLMSGHATWPWQEIWLHNH